MKQKIVKARKQNMKIYALYRAISLDLIFYYAIEFLFLTQVKHISSADVVLSQAFYAIFMIILQIPASIFVDRVGTRKCCILGNVFNALFVILIMICPNLPFLIFAQLISSICFSLKDISDSALITYSIPESTKQKEIYSRLEGKGFKDYYLLSDITSIMAGCLYVINPYIPMIGALCFTLFGTFISLGFQDIEEHIQSEKQTPTRSFQTYINDFIDAMKFIIKSQRLRSLFLYSGITWGVFCLMGTYRNSLLVDIGTPEQIITIIAAIVGITAAKGSKQQTKFHNRFRNKSLSIILFSFNIAILIAGIMGVINFSYSITLCTITLCFSIINYAKGMNGVLTTRYLTNFASEKILTQIYAINAISRNVFRAMIGFLGSYLLRITNTANSMIVFGIILLIVAISLTNYMKTRLGLRPEQYSKEEISGRCIVVIFRFYII